MSQVLQLSLAPPRRRWATLRLYSVTVHVRVVKAYLFRAHVEFVEVLELFPNWVHVLVQFEFIGALLVVFT